MPRALFAVNNPSLISADFDFIVQSHPVNRDTEGTIESVRIERVESACKESPAQ